MKIIRFSKGFVPAIVISGVIILVGIVSFLKDGFNFGVDFRAGLIQEVQFAPPAFSLVYSGQDNAAVSMTRSQIDIVVSGVNVENTTHTFPFAQYSTIGSLANALSSIDGIKVDAGSTSNVSTAHLIQSAHGNPKLSGVPYVVHYLPPGSPVIPIDEVRAALSPLGTVSVQVLGREEDRRFMIRMEDKAGETVPTEAVIAALETAFGEDAVAVTRSDYVGSRFSEQLQTQAGLLFVATLILILIYASIRFKIEYAIGAVAAIAHDALIMVTFICLTNMEFNTTTIAALLTILGYSINDTIVIFDRIRETSRVYPDDTFENILNRSISETLGRTIITTVTTMLAVLSLFIFTTGSMKDFALALLVGMVSGVYSTIFIASSFVYLWRKRKLRVKADKPVPVADVKAG
ncbi:MAG: protein translocase subunit SecF [Spirochaetaceae bacterium]|jgi:preprotein translocase subunit SecF|nr:protein translocase subunit SecF [Spirochaetaceae bacterium]